MGLWDVSVGLFGRFIFLVFQLYSDTLSELEALTVLPDEVSFSLSWSVSGPGNITELLMQVVSFKSSTDVVVGSEPFNDFTLT